MIKIKKGDISLLWITFLLILSTGLFDIYGTNSMVFGAIRLRDLSFAINIIYFVCVLIKYRVNPESTYFTPYLICMVMITVVADIVAYAAFSQPLVLGFSAQRDLFSGLCVAIAICWTIKAKVDFDHFTYAIKFIFAFKLVLNILTWIIYSVTGTVLFEGAYVMNQRYGDVRMFFSQSDGTALLMGLCLNDLLKTNSKGKSFNIICFILGFFYFFTVCKLRAASVALLFATTFVLVIWKGKFLKKSLLIFTAIGVAIILYFNLPIIQDLVNQLIFHNYSMETNTMLVRDSARAYYLEKFIASPIFGWGVPHTDWSVAFAMQGQNRGYYFSDNGVFSFLYQYGCIGLFWLILFIRKYYVISKQNIKNRQNYVGAFFGIFQLIMLVSGMFWIIGNSQIILGVVLAIISGLNDKQ